MKNKIRQYKLSHCMIYLLGRGYTLRLRYHLMSYEYDFENIQ